MYRFLKLILRNSLFYFFERSSSSVELQASTLENSHLKVISLVTKVDVLCQAILIPNTATQSDLMPQFWLNRGLVDTCPVSRIWPTKTQPIGRLLDAHFQLWCTLSAELVKTSQSLKKLLLSLMVVCLRHMRLWEINGRILIATNLQDQSNSEVLQVMS